MKCIDELFEGQAERTPDSIAVVFGESRLTYRELNRRAEELAQELRALDVGPDVLVGLFLERSLDMVVGMLAVLKAGGAYVPLDPNHPIKRLAYMLLDAQPLVILTQTRVQSRLPEHSSQVVIIDAESTMLVQHPLNAGRVRTPRDLAYVIYTSGSTGEPKGVEIEHRAVVNMLASVRSRPGFSVEDKMLAITTLGFDIAVLEIFLPLTCGAMVVIAPSETVGDGVALSRLIERSGASVMQATPATLRMLLDAGWVGVPRLKIFCGGEAWTTDLASQLLPRCGSLWNMYGPTETTVWSAIKKVETGKPIVIGPPIANTQFYVLDQSLQLVPVGVPGELHIGGEGLARGYLHRPQLTRERFVSDPFSEKVSARIYRTGDSVRRLPDGTLEFLGRLDNQVKIRGHRIELGEIEATLKRHSGIEVCVVVAREVQREQQLVAYYVSTTKSAIPGSELRQLLGETLPSYMIPLAFVSLASFPLTPGGKLDRKALPPPGVSASAADVVPRAPGTPTEEVLAGVWCKILNLKQVDVRANFFDLGGYSLLAARVVAEINKTLKAQLNIPAFFRNPSIEQLAKVLDLQDARPKQDLVALQTGRSGIPLYFIGTALPEHRIAQLIGKHRAIFGMDVSLPVKWSDAIAAVDHQAMPTVEQLGELYGNALYEHVGSSPCIIVGCYFGGKIAFEAARVLGRDGGNVALVLLIDAFTWSGSSRGALLESLRWISHGVTAAASKTSDMTRVRELLTNCLLLIRWLLARLPGAVKSRVAAIMTSAGSLPSRMDDKEGVPFERTVMSQFTRFATESFHPRPLAAAGALIRVKFPDQDMLPGHDLTNGWRDLFVQGLEVVEVAGDHVSMVSDENAASFARQINAVLDRNSLSSMSGADTPNSSRPSNAQTVSRLQDIGDV